MDISVNNGNNRRFLLFSDKGLGVGNVGLFHIMPVDNLFQKFGVGFIGA